MMEKTRKALLVKLVGEMKKNGEDMSGLLRSAADIQFWLRERMREDEASFIGQGFTLSGSADGLVWLHEGPQREVLVDFKGDGTGQP